VIGQHTVEILQELGLDDTEVERVLDDGAVYAPPAALPTDEPAP
jgi:hypothetical protein